MASRIWQRSVSHHFPFAGFVYDKVSHSGQGTDVINDTYGHKTGDEIIKRAANCLYKVLSTYGKVYRTGGDEFVGIIYVSLKELNNILTNIKHEIDIENYKCKIKLSLSIGTADFNENSNLNIEEIIQSADKNMYLNKNDFHKNNVF